MSFKHAFGFLLVIGLSLPSIKARAELKGDIRIDGSSTVFPISEAVAEEFGRKHKKVRVTVGTSGTGGGFKKFVLGEIDINDAFREIKPQEKSLAEKNKVKYIELAVAYDGITIVVSPKNTWVDHLTTEELKKLWEPGSKITTWKELRPTWPDEKIILYGPGPDSGTFDFFTEAINGKSQASRSDYTKSEDDNVLVQGVAGEKNALGYFGYAYFHENRTRIKAVPVKDGAGKPVLPNLDTIKSLSYQPLSRKVFIYVTGSAAKRPEVQAFVDFYLTEGGELAKEVGYIPMPKEAYEKERAEFKKFSSSK